MTSLAEIEGYRCYEDPVWGDEACIIVIAPCGTDLTGEIAAYDIDTVREYLEEEGA